jgi:hypothetical protein
MGFSIDVTCRSMDRERERSHWPAAITFQYALSNSGFGNSCCGVGDRSAERKPIPDRGFRGELRSPYGRRTHVPNERKAARREGDLLLDLLPIRVIDRRVDHRSPIGVLLKCSKATRRFSTSELIFCHIHI